MEKIFNNKIFSGNIKLIISQFEYDLKIIIPDDSMICTCVSPDSKAIDLKCPKCLGTGHRIRIRNYKGANRANMISFRTYGVSENSVTNIFYFRDAYPVKKDDIIVDGSDMFLIENVKKETGANNSVIYYRAEANPVKLYNEIRLENFKKIIGA